MFIGSEVHCTSLLELSKLHKAHHWSVSPSIIVGCFTAVLASHQQTVESSVGLAKTWKRSWGTCRVVHHQHGGTQPTAANATGSKRTLTPGYWISEEHLVITCHRPGRPQNVLAVLITAVDLKPDIIVLDKQSIMDNHGIFLSAPIPTLQTGEGRAMHTYPNRKFKKLHYPKMNSFPKWIVSRHSAFIILIGLQQGGPQRHVWKQPELPGSPGLSESGSKWLGPNIDQPMLNEYDQWHPFHTPLLSHSHLSKQISNSHTLACN